MCDSQLSGSTWRVFWDKINTEIGEIQVNGLTSITSVGLIQSAEGPNRTKSSASPSGRELLSDSFRSLSAPLPLLGLQAADVSCRFGLAPF